MSSEQLRHATWVFVRHGESEYSQYGRYTGTTDIALTEYGHDQAFATGTWIRDQFAPDQVFVSPKIRTQETWKCLDRALREGDAPRTMVANTDDRLREVSYGNWEGLTKPEIFALDNNHGKKVYDDWEENPVANRAGSVGETADEVVDRVYELVSGCDQGTTWFVTHRTVMRTMMAKLLGTKLQSYRKQFEQHHASVNAFRATFDGTKLQSVQLLVGNGTQLRHRL